MYPTDLLRRREPRTATELTDVAERVGAGNLDRRIAIAAGRTHVHVLLADTASANRIWAALPFAGTCETWGDAVHFEVPVASGRDRTARLMVRPGDLCFWVEERRLLLAYGMTPISRDGEVRMPHPVNVIGHAIDDVMVLRQVTPGEKVVVMRIAGAAGER